MNDGFVFVASCVCLFTGAAFCFLPVSRYWRGIAVGAFGPLLLVLGAVMMTTFKWTEVAIKVSGLEVKIAEAEKKAADAVGRLAAVERGTTPQAKNQALQTLLATYSKVSADAPSEKQVEDFNAALTAAKVTVVPIEALNAVQDYQKFEIQPN